MELNITKMLDQDLGSFSNSIANTGDPNIGQVTWNNAKNCDLNFITEENREEIKDHFADFGAWDRDEINSWDDQELNALLIQLISGDLQEFLWARDLPKEEYLQWEEDNGGRIFFCDIEDHENFGDLFYYIGS